MTRRTIWQTTLTRPPRRAPATTPRTSPSSRASRPCGSARACTSAPPVCAVCTTWCTRSSTTPSTRRSPGYCDRVEVTIHPDNSITVVDDGRGIPVSTMEKEGRSALEVVLTVLHAGGKFGDGGGYKVSGGLHGVGVSVVNALSEKLHVEVCRDGFTLHAGLLARRPAGPDRPGRGHERDRHDDHVPAGRRGLRDARLRLRHARAAPAGDGVPHTRAAHRPEGRACGRPLGRVPLRGRDRGLRRLPQREQGPDPAQGHLLRGGEPARAPLEVAMQWNSSYQESIFSFANNINTHEGGSHLSGFRSALTRTLNRYAREKGHLKEKDDNLSGEDVREGLTAVISAKLSDPQFEGQTKTKLGNPGMQGFVESVVNARLAEFLEENPHGGQRGHPQGRLRRPGPCRRAQGARPHPAQVGAGELRAARQAGRLLDPRPVAHRALHRRGRLRRRLGQAGPRPRHPGRAAAAGQDPQRREGADRPGAPEPGDPGADHGARHGRARGVRRRAPALPQDHPDDGRRRGRRAHPHADPHAAVPGDAGARRVGLHLHRQAAALQAQAGPAGALHREGERARGHPPRRQARALRGHGLQRPAVPADGEPLAALLPAAQAVRGLGVRAARRARARHGHVPRGVADPRRAGDERRGAGGAARPRRRRRASPTRPSCCPRRTASSASARWSGRPTSRARTACAGRCSTTTSTGSSRACTASW